MVQIEPGINRAQLTLQELQDLAERQRQQILYNSKELMEKQQQLMRMHHDFRSKAKVTTTQPLSPISPPKERTPREQDAYARMLRETYQSHMGKLHGMSQAQHEIDVQKFSNIELAHELDKVRAIFSSKQSELADAVKKVDVLTKQLDERKNGASNWNQLPTPERINRRRKIQAAKEELDRLRNELIVRNETNTQQNHQLQLQRDIIQEKKHELRELNNRMHQIGSALRQQYGKNFDPDRAPPNYAVANGFDNGLFNDNYLQDTLTRKRNNSFIGDTFSNAPDGKAASPLLGTKLLPYSLRGELVVPSEDLDIDRPTTERNLVNANNNDVNFVNGYDNAGGRVKPANGSPYLPMSRSDVASDDTARVPISPVFKEAPLSGNQIWKNQSANVTLRSEIAGSGSPSPAASVSTPFVSGSQEDHLKAAFFFGKEPPPPPPPRTTPIGVLIDRNQPPSEPPSAEYLASLRKQKGAKVRSERSSESSPAQVERTSRPVFTDFGHSLSSDELQTKVGVSGDAAGSIISDTLKPKEPPALKPKPVLPAKPTASVAPLVAATDTGSSVDRADNGPQAESRLTRRLSLLDDDPNFVPSGEEHSHLIRILSKDRIPKDLDGSSAQDIQEQRPADDNPPASEQEDLTLLLPSPPAVDARSELEEFQLSFADIDEINLTQTDLVPWNMGDSTSVSSQDDSGSEASLDMSLDINVVPVVISVPPEKMPPPILKRPDTRRGHNRRIVLDPFTLLLDAALEGEMETVKLTLAKVPDPSRPNAEGITPLHNAVCGNHKEVVKFLVEVGCDINAADNNGWTPLHCAAFYNDTELCRFLVEHGASVFATTYTDYQTPAHKCSRLDDNYDQCFAYLHECKENVGRANNGLVYALFDYTAEEDDELSFHAGEALTIIRRGDAIEKEWWWAKSRRGDMGYVPCNLIGNFARIAAEV